MAPRGYFALVLHAHLPFVRHPESENYLEERWLFEAMTETYIPLLEAFQKLRADGVSFRMTLSLTPTLISMLSDSLLQERYLKHMEKLILLAEKEIVRTAREPEFHRLAMFYRDKFIGIREVFLKCDGNLIAEFSALAMQGNLEIITSAATHAFLPLMHTKEAMRAQIETGVQVYQDHFHRPPQGIWLPECGYAPGIDKLLRDAGIEYFFTDTHGVTSAEPRPVFGTMSPVLTPAGVAAFARDAECSKQVWSSLEGYPGDFNYREFYRDVGFEIDEESVREFIHPSGIQSDTGIKYYRITGRTDHKEPYNLEWALDSVSKHAEHFLQSRIGQIGYWSNQMGRRPIVIAPFDAELFGHWWYEGPQWIETLFRKMAANQDVVEPTTPSRYLRHYDDFQTCSLGLSSWGRDGYADVWLTGENDWIYPQLHACELEMVSLANAQAKAPAANLVERALNQAARELMLAQSSDFAFIMDNKTVVDYAVRRTKWHVNRFRALAQMVRDDVVDEAWLQSVESLDSLFLNIDYRHYASSTDEASAVDVPNPSTKPACRVLMLSWEFPPMTVGGLSRHVYDLARHLAQSNCEVHVVTTEIGDYPLDEQVQGVHVHRVRVPKPDGEEFVHFAFQLNLAMISRCYRLLKTESFDVIHAHDWLVCYAAQELKQLTKLPLVSTVHATEHGRNQGIRTDLQRYIHHLEWTLTYESARVIVCSTYMEQEVRNVFELPRDKVLVVPNGIDPLLIRPPVTQMVSKQRYAQEGEKIVLFVGRMVTEKGVQVLLEAAPKILFRYNNVRFLIAGKGPVLEHLRQRAHDLRLGDRVRFLGFIPDEERNELFRVADVAVFPSLYEPFGIVALEAMAAETPVVVSDVGGLADVVQHGHNGRKAIPGDSASLAAQVLDILTNPEEAERLASVAKKEIARYDWKSIAAETLSVYQTAMKDAASESAVPS